MSDDTQPSYGNKPGLANKYFYLEILNSQITLPLSSFIEKLLSGFKRLSMYCLHTSVSHLIPCHRKYSQSESRKTVVYLMVLYPTFPKCAAILLPPKFSKRRRFPSSILEVLFSDFLAISEQNFSLGFNFEVDNTFYLFYKRCVEILDKCMIERGLGLA